MRIRSNPHIHSWKVIRFSRMAIRFSRMAIRFDRMAIQFDRIAIRSCRTAIRFDRTIIRSSRMAIRFSRMAIRSSRIAIRFNVMAFQLDRKTFRSSVERTRLYVLSFDLVRYLGQAFQVVFSTQPQVVAGVGRDAGQAQALVGGVGLAQEGVQGQDAGAFGWGQDAAFAQ